MRRLTTYIRQPVKRQGAEQYLLFTLLSFAASVTFTRLFLELAGYPQLGGGTLHIAHVLWGGLLLFIAALLPLVFSNRWVYTAGAILAGTGVGLFIDEVGKFITQENDYFYPLAAPIIYAFFLLTVLVYTRVKRPLPRNPRVELYRALDALEEVLEHDLDEEELAELEARLAYVAEHSHQPDLARLAGDLHDYLQWDALSLAPPRSTLLQRTLRRWQRFEEVWLTRGRLKVLLTTWLLALGLLALANMALALPNGPTKASLEPILRWIDEATKEYGSTWAIWLLARLALETSVGLLLLISGGLMLAGKELRAVFFGSTCLLLELTTINLLVFYFDQFSAILTATGQFVLFLGLLYYRRRFLQPPPEPAPVSVPAERSADRS